MSKECESIQESRWQAVYDTFSFVLDRIVAKIFYSKIQNYINKHKLLLLKEDTLFFEMHSYLCNREHFKSIFYLLTENEKYLISDINKIFGSGSEFDEFFVTMDDYESIFNCDQNKLIRFISIIDYLMNINSFNSLNYLCINNDDDIININNKFIDPLVSDLSKMEDIIYLMIDCESRKSHEISDEHFFIVLDSFFRRTIAYVDDSSKWFFLAVSKYGHYFFVSLIEQLLKNKDDSKKISEEIMCNINKMFNGQKTMGNFECFVKKYILITQSLKENYGTMLKQYDSLRNIRNKIMHNIEHNLKYGGILMKIANHYKELQKLLSEFMCFDSSEMKEFFDNLLSKIDEFEISERLLNALILVHSDIRKKKHFNGFKLFDGFWF